MGLGPHSPHRPPHRDDAGPRRVLLSNSDARARARTRNRKPGTRFRSSSAECSRARGWTAFALQPPPSEPQAVGEDRERLAYERRAGRRPLMELCPDSIRSSTSCHAIAARPVGNRRRLPRSLAEATPPGGAIPPHEPPSRERGLRERDFREGGRARDPPDRPACAGRLLTAACRSRWVNWTERALRRVCTRSASSPGTVGDADCSRNLPPGLRAASPEAPRRDKGSADTRGAFRRWAALVDSTGLSSRVIYPGRVFSTVCRQSVESTRRPFRLRKRRPP